MVISEREIQYPKEKAISQPRVAIIILHFASDPLAGKEALNTMECLEAISRIDYSNFQTIVVDAGSRDEFASKFSQERKIIFPYPLTYLRIEDNIGCAAGYNLGVELALKDNPSYVFLLNNDTILAENALSKLVDFAEHHPEIGAIGPKVYDYQNGVRSNKLQTIGGKFISGNYGGWQTDRGQFEEPRPVDFVSGAACLIKASVIREIGLFDPEFFIWFEDIDFGIRLQEAGYKAYYCPAETWHKGTQSLANRFGPRYAYYSTRNLLYMIRKYPTSWKIRLVPRFVTVNGKTFLGAVILGRKETLSSMIRGVHDGFKKSQNE